MSEGPTETTKVYILLVDDQPANLLALEAVLADLGQDLVRVTSGEEALSWLVDHDCAVVLLDVQMQGLNGFDTARLIRQRDRSRRTPIIFLTAFEDPQLTAADAYRLGAVDYLVKPVKPVILRAKVDVFVELFQKSEQIRRQAEALEAGERLQAEMRERMEAERRAEEARLYLAAIVESSDDAIVAKDLNGVITSWNRGAERLLGYSPGEVIGKPVSMLIPDDHAQDMATVLEHIRRGERVDHFETKRRRKDGTIVDVSLTVSPIRNAAGVIIGASKVARDISQQKRAEAERKEADRRKDEFLAMLAHELRNPISAISNAVRLFGMTGMVEELEWAKEVVDRQVKHLARLLDDLLDVSRITRGKIELRKERVDLASILDSAIADATPHIEERKHRLIGPLVPGALWLDADPTRVHQVLVNLLTNAAKYTEAGGTISVTTERENGHVVIRVRDTGVGIPPETLPLIFELFAQGDRSLARTEGGLGIGLTIVKRLVELHGGSVSAVSPGPGKGSEFTVRFPAADEPESGGHTAGLREGPGRAKGSRVLIVDDNVDTARGLAKLLKLLGHEVRTAHDGPAAIETARDHRPEIVLLDIGLPGMDGYEVARKLRQEELCRDSVIIAITGYGQDEDRRRAREAGFDHHMVKPVDYKALVALLA